MYSIRVKTKHSSKLYVVIILVILCLSLVFGTYEKLKTRFNGFINFKAEINFHATQRLTLKTNDLPSQVYGKNLQELFKDFLLSNRNMNMITWLTNVVCESISNGS